MDEIKISWLMHSCFLIEYSNAKLVIDPHDGGSLGEGIPAPQVRADYVLVSHEHYDHNAVSIVSKDDTLVVRERIGDFTLGPFHVTGVRLPHDEFNGRIRGHVVAYIIEVAGLRLLHLSDLGRPLTSDEAESIGEVDVIMAPAGNVYTLHPRQALDVAEELKAKILIPMHYWLPGIQLPLDPIDVMLRYAKKWRIVWHSENSIIVSRDAMPKEKTIIILAPPKEYKKREA